MQDNTQQGVNFEAMPGNSAETNENSGERYLTPEEARIQAGFESLSDAVAFAGETSDNDDNSDTYADTQLDGRNEQSDSAFNGDEHDEKAGQVVVSEDEMNEENFTDERLDNSKETLVETLDYENANYGFATVSTSLKLLAPLADKITNGGVVEQSDDVDPDEGKIETQGNNLCKATAIYALNAKQTADTAIIRFSATKDTKALEEALHVVEKYSTLADQSAALATNQAKLIASERLRNHIQKRIDEALDMIDNAIQRLKETNETGEPQIDLGEVSEDDIQALAEDNNEGEQNTGRAISSIGARIDKIIELDDEADSVMTEKLATDESEISDTSENNNDSFEGFLAINQEEPAVEKSAAADDITDNPDYYSSTTGEQGEA